MTLTNVARSSLEELKLDYLDFLRQRKLMLWKFDDPRSREIIKNRFNTADEFALWVKHNSEMSGNDIGELAANGILVLISVACSLLSRQLKSLAETFEKEGGFSERLHRHRTSARRNSSNY